MKDCKGTYNFKVGDKVTIVDTDGFGEQVITKIYLDKNEGLENPIALWTAELGKKQGMGPLVISLVAGLYQLKKTD